MKIPFQIYDFLSILFPSIIILFLIQTETDKFNFFSNYNNVQGISFGIVLAYLVGDLLSKVSSKIEKSKIRFLVLIFPNKRPSLEDSQMLLRSRTMQVVLNKDIGNEIVKSVRLFYGIPISSESKDLFNLVYAPVQDRMAKRDTFLSIANMMRSFTIISILYELYLIYKISFDLIKGNFDLIYVLLLLVNILLFFSFRSSYAVNKYYSEIIPFTAFLSWYKEKYSDNPNNDSDKNVSKSPTEHI